jgi:putative phosphoesterase
MKAHRRTAAAIRVGVISDTHGLLRPEALAFLRGSDRILHAGDIGSAQILAQLSAIAPVTAVRGNNDEGAWAQEIPETQRITIGGAAIYLIHDLARLDVDPVASGIRVVVSGHSHRPRAERRGEVLYLNPGSAGPRRFRLPVAVAELLVTGEDKIDAKIVELDVVRPSRS